MRFSSETLWCSSETDKWKLIFGNFKVQVFFGNYSSETNLRKLYGVLQKLMFGNYKQSKSNIKLARKSFCRSQNKHVYIP